MNRIEIRTLTIEDYSAIVELWKRARLPAKPKGRDSRHMIENQMNTFPSFFVGAFHEEKLVGVVIGSYDGRMKGWISRLAVDPEHRRRGIAQRLVKAIEKALREWGAAVFCALVETLNEESLGLFQKMGYTVHRDILYVTKREGVDA